MTLGPEAPTGRDVQGSGGRRNPAGSGRSRSWPTPILCDDLSFFYKRGGAALSPPMGEQLRSDRGYGTTNHYALFISFPGNHPPELLFG